MRLLLVALFALFVASVAFPQTSPAASKGIRTKEWKVGLTQGNRSGADLKFEVIVDASWPVHQGDLLTIPVLRDRETMPIPAWVDKVSERGNRKVLFVRLIDPWPYRYEPKLGSDLVAKPVIIKDPV